VLAQQRTQGEGVSATLLGVDEGRKRVLLIAASILAARKLGPMGWEAVARAVECAIADAISLAARIMSKIDDRRPTYT
jgi:hypothetical protein